MAEIMITRDWTARMADRFKKNIPKDNVMIFATPLCAQFFSDMFMEPRLDIKIKTIDNTNT